MSTVLRGTGRAVDLGLYRTFPDQKKRKEKRGRNSPSVGWVIVFVSLLLRFLRDRWSVVVVGIGRFVGLYSVGSWVRRRIVLFRLLCRSIRSTFVVTVLAASNRHRGFLPWSLFVRTPEKRYRNRNRFLIFPHLSLPFLLFDCPILVDMTLLDR
jgi:hypothetical protein